MSNLIRKYKCGEDNGFLEVIALMGTGKELSHEGADILFKVINEDGEYSIRLSGTQVVDLIKALINRITFQEGFCATDDEKWKGYMLIDGTIKMEGEKMKDKKEKLKRKLEEIETDIYQIQTEIDELEGKLFKLKREKRKYEDLIEGD